jgi:hypothetical protein
LIRFRFVWIAITASVITQRLVAAAGPHRFNDWLTFESAARYLIHYHHLLGYLGDPLALYTQFPIIQVGPPAILPVTAMQFLSPWTVNRLFVGVMIGLGFLAIIAAELTARTGGRPTPRDVAAPAALIGGLTVIVDWSWSTVRWHHLDDAMALSFTAVACWLIARGRPWWLIGLLLGTAIAAKPWALILAPVVLGLNRSTRSKAALVMIATAGAWWAPFVIGAPGTISALGAQRIDAHAGSVLALIGIHGQVQHWLRPVQFIGGLTAGLLVARIGGRAWLAAPLAALAIRVMTDPFLWGYYGMGPILFALMWDLGRPHARRVPIYTLVTGVIEGLLPKLLVVDDLLGPMTTQAYLLGALKLAWCLGILVALALELRRWRHSAWEAAQLRQFAW